MPEIPVSVWKSLSGAQVYGCPETSSWVSSVVPSALLPLYRPPLPEVAPMLDALRAEAADVARRLEDLA